MFKQLTSMVKPLLFRQQHPEIVRLKKDGFTYLKENALVAIKETVKSIEKQNVPGIFIETGCALGGSAILISLFKKQERRFFVYDVFGMIPAPSEKDGSDIIERYDVIKSGKSKGINNNTYYGYEADLKTKVVNNFRKYNIDLAAANIELIEGLYQNTLHIQEPVAFAHIDCDWYESVMTCLQQIVPHLAEKSTLIIDDYYDWSGCRKATDDYFNDKSGTFKFYEVARKLHVKRTA